MTISVRKADLAADKSLIIDTLFRFLTPQSDCRRFDWLYEGNPCGPAEAWVAEEPATGEVIGLAAAFPRRLYIGERIVPSWVLGDFCIHPGYRSLGPALQLQRACHDGMRIAGVGMFYDFPSTSMMAVFRRLGVQSRDPIVRYAKLLRVDRQVNAKLGNGSSARAVRAVGNVALRLLDRGAHGDCELLWLKQGERCGDEFTHLAERLTSCHGGCVQRSASYLSWRYFANPLQSYEIVVARRSGNLEGYAAVTVHGDDALLVDLFGDEECGTLALLVAEVVAIARKRGAITLSAPLIRSHRWGRMLEHLGFRARETSPFVVYPASVGLECEWLMMNGDRDS